MSRRAFEAAIAVSSSAEARQNRDLVRLETGTEKATGADQVKGGRGWWIFCTGRGRLRTVRAATKPPQVIRPLDIH
jgi:hypothetical protein